MSEIKRRRADGNPFLTLADFINRDPSASDVRSRRRGVLQEAIDQSGVNSHLERPENMVDTDNIYTSAYPDGLMEGSVSTGVPGFLMQSDVLLKLGPFLSARSDTFIIRAYGSSEIAPGRQTVEVWCEAVVQRLPETLDGGNERRFVIASFRWLNADEI